MKQTKTIGINGMHCASCSARVEKSLSLIPGMIKAHVNLAWEEASVDYDDRRIDLEKIKQVIGGLGYSVREDEMQEGDENIRQMRSAGQRMWLTWAITLVIMVFMLPHMILGKMIAGHHVDMWTMFFLSLAAILIPAQRVFVSAWRSVRSGSANMDVLISLGAIASLIPVPLSFVHPGIQGHAFAGLAAMILAFHLTGRYVESRARGKASEAIRKLINLGAKTALIIEDGIEMEVPVHKIKAGDVFVVKPGMKIATDGIIVSGTASIDESMATGESLPVTRTVNDKVLGATLNLDGAVQVKATNVGSDTFLAQVIKLVKQAQHSKVPIQVLADRITSVFVPVILVLAGLTLAIWILVPEKMIAVSSLIIRVLPLNLPTEGIAAAFMASIAVLVIACPCALGLATPTALMVGSGMGAQRGILIRNGETLQTMKAVKVMVFDKTGTLTSGKPQLLKTISLGESEPRVMEIAASLAAGSEHPLSGAILQKAWEMGISPTAVDDFKSFSGKGVRAEIRGLGYFLGSAAFLEDHRIPIAPQLVENLSQGYLYASRVYLADKHKVLGFFLIADTLKPGAMEVVNGLKIRGIRTVMISGDNRRTAEAMAAQCGIDEVIAEVMPADKAKHVMDLQSKFGCVAMVGDGINDAPALKQADIGIAMGQGTDIAIETADITIVRSDLHALLAAVNLSVMTFGKIKQNLFWAFFYNLVAIPLAVLGLLHPVIAEIAMATSSITVVTNANLLKRKGKMLDVRGRGI